MIVSSEVALNAAALAASPSLSEVEKPADGSSEDAAAQVIAALS